MQITETFPTRQGSIVLNPGQLKTGTAEIAEGVSWHDYGVRKGPNKKAIQDILNWLEHNAMITISNIKHGMVIDINDWDAYKSY